MSIDRSPTEERWWPWRVLMAGLTLAVVLLAVPVARHFREIPASPPPAALRLSWTLPADAELGSGPGYPFGLALSPDGRFVALAPRAEAEPKGLILHDLASGVTRDLPGTAGGRQPFWSPDASRLAFFASGELRVAALDGSDPVTLAAAPNPMGGVWDDDGTIVFAPGSGGLMDVADTGGDVRVLTVPDTARGDTSHRFPQLAGSGGAIVLLVTSTDRAREGLWAFVRASGEMTRLASTAAHALAHGDDILVLRDEALVAERLDPGTGRLVGRATFVSLPVGRGRQGELFASISKTGVLMTAPPLRETRELRWFTRAGTPAGVIGDPGAWQGTRIAPDGRRVALVLPEPMLGTLDIWVGGPEDPRPRRLSPSIDADDHPVWSPDGSRVAWVNARQSVVVRGALGELEEVTIWRGAAPIRLSHWTRDGRWLVFSERSATTGDDVWLLPVDGEAPVPYLQTPFDEHSGTVSPDGRWMAYASNESGATEIYVDRFPAPGDGTRERITTNGGVEPRWRADGRELFMRRGRDILATAVSTHEGRFRAGDPTRLLEAEEEVRSWDISPDGRRLLLNLAFGDDSPRTLSVTVHWKSLLR